MIRLYGQEPYNVVLVHGGPGAIGSLKGFARELADSMQMGVVEALQSKYSIDELIEELCAQIEANCTSRVSLIGHSWGAWLALLFAQRYPELAERIVLVGCPPLKDEYVRQIGVRRMRNLAGADAEVFVRLMNGQATNEDMAQIPRILDSADNYALADRELHRADYADSEMHNRVWREAAALRTSGAMLDALAQVRCRLYLIQGEYDPHPEEGVIVPLRERGIFCEAYLLEKCGHSPFMERYAKEEFYRILRTILDAGQSA